MRIVVFDTETTGLPKTKVIAPDTLDQWPHIVQFSYVVYDSSLNIVVDQFDHIIRLPPNVIIPEEAVNIHHITNEKSASEGSPLNEVLNEFFYYAQCADKIVGHNIEFDLNMLKVELCRMIYGEHARKSVWKQDLHFLCHFEGIGCTMKESAELCNLQSINRYGDIYMKYPKLVELHQKLFGSVPNGLHNSLHDVLITLRCYVQLHIGYDLYCTCYSYKKIVQTLDIM
jgi:DNA polymerase III epsilon subunit-like protein